MAMHEDQIFSNNITLCYDYVSDDACSDEGVYELVVFVNTSKLYLYTTVQYFTCTYNFPFGVAPTAEVFAFDVNRSKCEELRSARCGSSFSNNGVALLRYHAS